MAKKKTPQLKTALAPPAKTVEPNGVVFDPHPDLQKMQAEDRKNEETKQGEGLFKSIINVLNGSGSTIERLAFEEDPSQASLYGQLWRQKTRLLPDAVIKRLQIQDDLVAAITNARAAQMSVFGRKRADRFGMGFELLPKKGLFESLSAEEQKNLKKEALAVEAGLMTCGNPNNWNDADQESLSAFLVKGTKNAIGPGRVAVEIIRVTDTSTGEERFHGFRAIDAATIYRAAPRRDESAAEVRQQALSLLEGLSNTDLTAEDRNKIKNNTYEWVQVIEGTPRQTFTAEECVVHNFYPVNDIELNGYPVTPLDTVITAVTTHINITTHNKMYFQTGRATRGMLVVKSADISPAVVARLRQQFNASINSSSNAWRMPVFGIGPDDDMKWTPIDSGTRDMEFQYLSDSNARVILSAFQMSPEELPGYAHLSRGTNNQALSESNNEYQMTAHRDVGLRPLVMQWEDFFNEKLLPLFSTRVAKYFRLCFLGLDAETAEKESIRLQQDAPIWMSFNDVLGKVEKPALPKELGGDFPFNPAYQAILDKYFTVGEIKERFFGIEGASKDPDLQYFRDQFWFTNQSLIVSKQQATAPQQPPPGGGGAPGSAPSGPGPTDSGAVPPPEANAVPKEQEQNAQQALNEAQDALSKAERHLPLKGKRLLAHHSELVKSVMQGFREEQEKSVKEILDVVKKHPKK